MWKCVEMREMGSGLSNMLESGEKKQKNGDMLALIGHFSGQN